MLEKGWIKFSIGLVVFSTFIGGCAATGPTVSGSKPTVQPENKYDPARGLDPDSPSFWRDYMDIYGPK